MKLAMAKVLPFMFAEFSEGLHNNEVKGVLLIFRELKTENAIKLKPGQRDLLITFV